MTYSSLRALLVKRFDIPKEQTARKALKSFTIAEKAVFYFFVGLFIFSGLLLINQVNNSFLVEVPIKGGTLTEGVVGNPRFINPVLAFSEADKNLTTLVYSGLVRLSTNGEIVNDLADNVSISPDNLTYTIHLRSDAVFHDGHPVTSDDVEFTINKIENAGLKSPFFGTWSGITINKIDANTISFTLKKPYPYFIDNLTLGILPKHIWSTVSDDEFSFSQFNSLPIGSGPYKLNTVQRNSGGIPDYYDLTPFDKAADGVAFIDHLIFRFYPNQSDLLNAYDGGEISSISGFSPDDAAALKNENSRIISSPLPRVFGVFFNQSKNKALLAKEVRQALDLTAPKEEIIQDVLHGYGTAIYGPIPPGIFNFNSGQSTTTSMETRLQMATSILETAGWKKNPQSGIFEKKTKDAIIPLSFSISTSDAPELKAVAEKLSASWGKLGAKVDVQVFDSGDLNQNVIRPRKFEALLFGEVVGRDVDVYPFWHSSERNDPGLNIAGYANSKVDKLLDDARSTTDPENRENDYKAFDKEIRNDLPAIFLYTPSFLYLVPNTVKDINLGKLNTPQDRFLGAREWYIETNKVWNIFVK